VYNVGRRRGDGSGADQAAGAGTVVDHDRLTPRLGKLLPIARPTMSFEPPTANGIISVIGLDGYVCACPPNSQVQVLRQGKLQP